MPCCGRLVKATSGKFRHFRPVNGIQASAQFDDQSGDDSSQGHQADGPTDDFPPVPAAFPLRRAALDPIIPSPSLLARSTVVMPQSTAEAILVRARGWVIHGGRTEIRGIPCETTAAWINPIGKTLKPPVVPWTQKRPSAEAEGRQIVDVRKNPGKSLLFVDHLVAHGSRFDLAELGQRTEAGRLHIAGAATARNGQKRECGYNEGGKNTNHDRIRLDW